MGKFGSKWKHGYIPENPAATALKAHRKPKAVAKRQAAARANADQLAGMHKKAQAQAKLTARAKASLNSMSARKSTRKKSR